jgi:glucose/arabinose dehydrogenase
MKTDETYLYLMLLAMAIFFHTQILKAQSPPPGATNYVKVQVPASMRTAPFDVDRYLTIPEKFEISVFARINGARFMATAPNGDLLVSVPSSGKVKLVRTTSGDPSITDFVSGLSQPHDIVFHKIGSTMYVYISEQNQINRYTYNNGDLTGQSREIVVSGLPDASLPELHGSYAHALKNIALDDNHKLYISIASSCNACTSDTESDPVRGAIYIYNADGTNGRLFARGIRNAEGLDFIPGTNTLWVVVNNRDNMVYPFNDGSGYYGQTLQWFVDNHPPEEFTRIDDGGNYGWPFCNPDYRTGMNNMPFIQDYDLNRDNSVVDCGSMDRIKKGIQAHSAPLGFMFLQDTDFPSNYKNGAVIGLHGSWNRTKETGYKIIYFPWDNYTQLPGDQIDLVSGFLNADSTASFGRPVDVAVNKEGDLLFSEDQNGTIYKLHYTGVTAVAEKSFVNSLSLFPVPASQSMDIKFTSAEMALLNITLFAPNGKEILKTNEAVMPGDNIFTLNTTYLSPGIYFLSVQKGEELCTLKVVIQ